MSVCVLLSTVTLHVPLPLSSLMRMVRRSELQGRAGRDGSRLGVRDDLAARQGVPCVWLSSTCDLRFCHPPQPMIVRGRRYMIYIQHEWTPVLSRWQSILVLVVIVQQHLHILQSHVNPLGHILDFDIEDTSSFCDLLVGFFYFMVAGSNVFFVRFAGYSSVSL